MITTIILALAGVVVSVVIGSIWFLPSTPTGKIQMRFLGFDKLTPEEQAKKIKDAEPGMPKIYAGQMFLSLMTSIAVVFIVSMSLQNGVTFITALSFLLINWLCFVVPAVGMQMLWGNCEGELAWKKFFSDSLSILVTILVIAGMTYLFV